MYIETKAKKDENHFPLVSCLSLLSHTHTTTTGDAEL